MDFRDYKHCKTCKETKSLSDFYERQSKCKECCKTAQRARNASATAERRERQREWRKEYKRNKRRAEGIPTVQELALMRWRDTVWASIVNRANDYAKQRKTTITSAERFRVRYRTDPEFRLKQIMRTVMRKSAKKYNWVASYLASSVKNAGSRDRIWSVLGYTAEELLTHLQKQFTGGMTMDHFMSGEIHIDHIIPKSRFDMDDLDDVRACHALYNLRPMWAKDNISKATKVMTLL